MVYVAVCAVAVAMFVHWPIENLEAAITQPPHLGFILSNKVGHTFIRYYNGLA